MTHDISTLTAELPIASPEKDTYPIHTTNVSCTGNESRLTDCQHSTKHKCLHIEDVFVACKGPLKITEI